ncbi:MAG TPA: thiamine pyrophosphate-requiring protein [Verrucomicrobiae bacterium]|jgi:pyruvate dehydrogenase (quinone)|nr:thiamine pyrophosphate-requiring protein [Verrucomicrobiae bacterium]
MSETCGDFLIERLFQWGVRRIYGYPGDGINGILGALERAQHKIEFIRAAHEEMAAFMACGHAKFTGEVGVCMATSGPGAIHLLNGLYDAKMDHMPVVAIVGQTSREALGGSYQQEVDLNSLFKDVSAEYVQTASHPAQIRHLVDRAMRIAKAERTVTCLIIPGDLQEVKAVKKPEHLHSTIHSGLGHVTPRVIPAEKDLRRAAEILNAGKKVAMLIGAGTLHAPAEVIETAELLGAGVAKALLGKAALPDDLPFVTGAIGLLGTKPSWDLMMNCDTLFMIGTSFPYSEFLPEEGTVPCVQIDIDPRMLSLRYPADVCLAGDSAETLRALNPLLKRKEDRSWRDKIEKGILDWWKVLEGRAMNEANPINPQRIFWELSPRLPHGCILCSDSGSAATWFARDLKIRTGMMASLSGNLATMGPGVPYAIAAKFAFSDRPVIALVGDGAMQMNGNNELLTVAKYWKHWKDPRWIVLVLNNRDLNMVTWEERVLAGNPKFKSSQELLDFPFARYADMLGLKGIRLDRADNIVSALEEALHADRPVVIDAYTDPEVPPLPPHITLTQARKFAGSMLDGDPNAAHAMRQSFKDWVQKFLH